MVHVSVLSVYMYSYFLGFYIIKSMHILALLASAKVALAAVAAAQIADIIKENES